MLDIILFLTLIAIIILVVVITYPQFGAYPSSKELSYYKNLPNFNNNRFQNQLKTNVNPNPFKLVKGWFADDGKRKPKSEIQPLSLDPEQINTRDRSSIYFSWMGHSTILLAFKDKLILTDPVFSEVAAPFPFLGSKRFNKKMPIDLEDMPIIDVLLLSHDHYDHLDYQSIIMLKHRVKHFVTPLGVGRHLIKWGVHPDKITQLNWWESTSIDGLKLTSAPSRHFSGRRITDKNKSLWSSWVINDSQNKIYFSADSGYGPHFKEIAEKLGPFDFGFMECGQYNENWHSIHMFPEEGVQATLDLKIDKIIPIHWGAFSLALHKWKEPVERFIDFAKDKSINIFTPEIGDWVPVNDLNKHTKKWWKDLN